MAKATANARPVIRTSRAFFSRPGVASARDVPVTSHVPSVLTGVNPSERIWASMFCNVLRSSSNKIVRLSCHS